MNPEELKLIVETITTLGAQGKEAFIWFLVFKYGISALLWMTLFPAVLYTIYRVGRLMQGQEADWLRTVRKITHPSICGYIDEGEANAIIAEVVRLKGLDK